jgi:serine/threonine-protein kinase RsbW
MTTRDHAVFAARIENTLRIRDFVERACARAGVTEDDCFALKLAVDEASTNIIQHGYGADRAGNVEVEFEADGDLARVAITDTGRRFDPRSHPDPDLPGGPETPVGGLGVHLMRSSVDEVQYLVEPGGNRLVLIKKLQGRGVRKGVTP